MAYTVSEMAKIRSRPICVWFYIGYRQKFQIFVRLMCCGSALLYRQEVLGPVHICSRYTTPAKCSRNMFSVHERSYYEHCEMFSVPIRSGRKWHASQSEQYDVLCIHCATCEVILMSTAKLSTVHGLRAKPRPLSTLFSVHERSYLFWMCTKGAICSENKVWPCFSWNCSSGNNSL